MLPDLRGHGLRFCSRGGGRHDARILRPVLGIQTLPAAGSEGAGRSSDLHQRLADVAGSVRERGEDESSGEGCEEEEGDRVVRELQIPHAGQAGESVRGPILQHQPIAYHTVYSYCR